MPTGIGGRIARYVLGREYTVQRASWSKQQAVPFLSAMTSMAAQKMAKMRVDDAVA